MMTKSKFTVDVTSKKNARGKIQPVRFSWRDTIFEIEDTGRRWIEADGEHILVMTADSQTIELIHSIEKDLWQVQVICSPRRI